MHGCGLGVTRGVGARGQQMMWRVPHEGFLMGLWGFGLRPHPHVGCLVPIFS